MNRLFHLTFVSPCFCTGAKPLEAEIRPSSIRGGLRWWFRCLGGGRILESEVFGSPAGPGIGGASALLVRVRNVVRSKSHYAPSYTSPNDQGAYLHYFLAAHTDEKPNRLWAQQPVERPHRRGVVRADSFYPPDSSFELELRWLRPVSEDAKDLFDNTLDAFLRFGSLGYRKSRGFGSWYCAEKLAEQSETKAAFKPLEACGFSGEWSASSGKDVATILNQIEAKLKPDKNAQTGLRLKYPARAMTALGYSIGDTRQNSAVYFRPVQFKTKAGELQLVLLTFQAPDSVLGPDVLEPKRVIHSGQGSVSPRKDKI